MTLANSQSPTGSERQSWALKPDPSGIMASPILCSTAATTMAKAGGESGETPRGGWSRWGCG